MKITQIKTIVNCSAEEFDSDVNCFLAEIEDDLLYINFDGDESLYIAHIIYRVHIKE